MDAVRQVERSEQGIPPPYRVQRHSPLERLSTHPCLPAAREYATDDGQLCWEISQPVGTPMSRLIEESGGAPHLALEVVREVGKALVTLEEAGIFPVNLAHVTLWQEGAVLLDWPASLQQEEPDFPQLNEYPPTTARVVSLAALLYSILTGKSASQPPYIFTPLNRFLPQRSGALQDLIDRALQGTLTLQQFLQELRVQEVEQKLTELLPPSIELERTSPAMTPRANRPRRSGIGEWLLWLTCLVLGFVVLFRYG